MSRDPKTYYITTPIYYTSGPPHIGHAYCSIVADSLGRYHRLIGDKVFFLTGTDEHGQKVEEKAAALGISPQEYVDGLDVEFRGLWKRLQLTNDDYIRTTEPRHRAVAQKIFERLYNQGDIYKSQYKGHYCVPCEAFWTERQLRDGKYCPDCGREVEWVTEEAYYFKTSKYAPRLLAHIEEHPDFIQPVSRANEMINNFLKPGLNDLCVSRTGIKWGIPVTFDPSHVIYVWIDALSNYLSALGYTSEDDSLYRTYWPADLHLVGKEIIRFHTVIWPILLMALDLPLPKQIFGHGWLLFDNDKMSKSKGNVVDPNQVIDEFGCDALRYYLLAKVQLGSDANYTEELFTLTFNVDLANDLGNLLSRTVSMVERYFDGVVQAAVDPQDLDLEIRDLALTLPGEVAAAMEALHPELALAAIWKLVKRCNKYIDETAPWALARENNTPRLQTVLYTLVEALRQIAVLLQPFMPLTPPKIFEQLGMADQPDLHVWQSLTRFDGTPQGTKVQKGEAMFPRRLKEAAGEAPVDTKINTKGKKGESSVNTKTEIDKEPGETFASPASSTPSTASASFASAPAETAAESAAVPLAVASADPLNLKPQITIEDFAKIDLRIAKVIACEKVPKADRLLKLTLDVGGTTRTIVSGIAEHYSSEELVGQLICIVANLAPAKIRGVESHGMLLAASDEAHTQVIVLQPEKPLATGLRVK